MSSSAEIIRLLSEGDASIFRDLRLRSLKDEPEAFLHDYDDAKDWPPERFALFLKNDQMVGAFIDGALSAFASLSRYKGKKVQHKGMIGAVYVAPEARGRSLAAKMITQLEMIAKEQGIEQLMLSTNVKNDFTVALYKRLGYEPCGMEPHILKMADGSYIDDVLMIKYLKR